MTYDPQCVYCDSKRSSIYTVSTHFQGNKFGCGSIPAHFWAGKHYPFERTVLCCERQILVLQKQQSATQRKEGLERLEQHIRNEVEEKK